MGIIIGNKAHTAVLPLKLIQTTPAVTMFPKLDATNTRFTRTRQNIPPDSVLVTNMYMNAYFLKKLSMVKYRHAMGMTSGWMEAKVKAMVA